MPTHAPVAQPVSVRPLWERHELFREPTYDPSIALNAEQDDYDDTAPTGAH